MHRAIRLPLAILLLLVFAAPAAAQTPIDERRVREQLPLGTLDVTVEAGDGCDFPVLIEDVAGKITYVFITEDRHGNVLDRIIWHTTTRLTNVDDPSRSIETQFDSYGNGLFRPDGSANLRFRNDAIVWYAEGDPADLGPGMFLIDHGVIIEELGADGALISSDFRSGTVTDVCAALS